MKKTQTYLYMKMAATAGLLLLLTLLYFQSDWHDQPMDTDLGPTENRSFAVEWAHPGKVSYINFWAIWCEPCIVEIPEILKMDQDLLGQKIQIQLINVDRKPEDIVRAKKFIEENIKNINEKSNQASQIKFIYASDDSQLYKYNIEALPYHLLIDNKGRVAAETYGGRSEQIAKIKGWLLKLLAEPQE